MATSTIAPLHTARYEPATLTMDPVLMLAVGQSLRMLARSEKMPPGTREQYTEAGGQMVAAARAAIAQQAVKP